MPEIVSTIQKQRSHCEILQTPKSAEGNLKKYNYYVGWERFFQDLELGFVSFSIMKKALYNLHGVRIQYTILFKITN